MGVGALLNRAAVPIRAGLLARPVLGGGVLRLPRLLVGRGLRRGPVGTSPVLGVTKLTGRSELDVARLLTQVVLLAGAVVVLTPGELAGVGPLRTRVGVRTLTALLGDVVRLRVRVLAGPVLLRVPVLPGAVLLRVPVLVGAVLVGAVLVGAVLARCELSVAARLLRLLVLAWPVLACPVPGCGVLGVGLIACAVLRCRHELTNTEPGFALLLIRTVLGAVIPLIVAAARRRAVLLRLAILNQAACWAAACWLAPYC